MGRIFLKQILILSSIFLISSCGVDLKVKDAPKAASAATADTGEIVVGKGGTLNQLITTSGKGLIEAPDDGVQVDLNLFRKNPCIFYVDNCAAGPYQQDTLYGAKLDGNACSAERLYTQKIKECPNLTAVDVAYVSVSAAGKVTFVNRSQFIVDDGGAAEQTSDELVASILNYDGTSSRGNFDDLDHINSEFSVTAIVKSDDYAANMANGTLLDNTHPDNGGGFSLRIHESAPNEVSFSLFTKAVAATPTFPAKAPDAKRISAKITAAAYNYVVATYSNKEMKLYVNGELKANKTGITLVKDVSTFMTAGSKTLRNSGYFSGNASIEVTERAIPAPEVASKCLALSALVDLSCAKVATPAPTIPTPPTTPAPPKTPAPTTTAPTTPVPGPFVGPTLKKGDTGSSGKACLVNGVSIRSGTAGTPNGDMRFLCLDGRFYDCGWELNDPSWETKIQSDKTIKNWMCKKATNGQYHWETIVAADCAKDGVAGTHLMLGTPNGDKRFLCYADRFYSCGWEINDPRWETTMPNGGRIGDYACSNPNANNSGAKWITLDPVN